MQLPGTESEKGIVKALDDLFGPAVREVGTALGEWVRERRGRRLRATVDEAVAMARARGESLTPPPPKFLLPFMESASLEEDEDRSLNRMWAALLVDSGRSYSSGHPVFIDILKRMDRASAEVFDAIVERPTLRQWWISQLEDWDLEFRYRDLRAEVLRLAILTQTFGEIAAFEHTADLGSPFGASIAFSTMEETRQTASSRFRRTRKSAILPYQRLKHWVSCEAKPCTLLLKSTAPIAMWSGSLGLDASSILRRTIETQVVFRPSGRMLLTDILTSRIVS